jgi:cytochrome c2
MRTKWLLAVGLLVGCVALAGCTGDAPGSSYMPNMGGNPHRGRALIVQYGCGACHVVPGIYTARGVMGPPLYFFGRRTMIAGELPNSTDNLIRWLRNPPAVEPGTSMPNLGLNQKQARDIAAYLESLQ